jgi:hypothetical protein
MLGMMVNAEITAPSLAVFVRGTHEVGAFIELLAQHQRETENKKENKFWILHVCIFRLAYGHVTSGEMVDPSSGIRTTIPTTVSPNLEHQAASGAACHHTSRHRQQYLRDRWLV